MEQIGHFWRINPKYTQHSSILKAAQEVCLPIYRVATAVTILRAVNRDIASGDGSDDAWLVNKHTLIPPVNVIYIDAQISLG